MWHALARAESIVAAIDGAKLVIIPRAGHGLTLEAPAAVTDAIAAFLEEQEARSVGTVSAMSGKGTSTATSRVSVDGRAA